MAHIFKFRGPKIEKEETGDSLTWVPFSGEPVSALEARIREFGVDPIVFCDLIDTLGSLAPGKSSESKDKVSQYSNEELATRANQGLPIDWKNDPNLYRAVVEEVMHRVNRGEAEE